MKSIVPESAWKETIGKWLGAKACIWMYHTTHKTMAMRLDRRGEATALYVVATGCIHVSGPLGWVDAHIELTTSENEVIVRDAKNDFCLRCRSVGLFLTPAGSYDTTFEDWLSDAMPPPDSPPQAPRG